MLCTTVVGSESKEKLVERAMESFQRQLKTLKGGCRSSIRDLLRALDLRLTYDPDKKEGYLDCNPFVHAASN